MKFNAQNILKYGASVLIIGAVVVLFAPYILTRNFSGVSFTETGQIGDTIGGLTAPFVNLISAILVFLALYAQVEANRLIQKQIDDQKCGELQQKNFVNLFEIYRQVKDDLNGFSNTIHEGSQLPREYGSPSNVVTYEGREALEKFIRNLIDRFCINKLIVDEAKYKSLVSSLTILDLVSERIYSSPLSEIDKKTLFELVNYLFDSRIAILLPDKCPRCNKEHELFPEELAIVIERLKTNLNKFNVENPSSKS